MNEITTRKPSFGEKLVALILGRKASDRWSHPKGMRWVIERLYTATIPGLQNNDGVDVDKHFELILECALAMITLLLTRPSRKQ